MFSYLDMHKKDRQMVFILHFLFYYPRKTINNCDRIALKYETVGLNSSYQTPYFSQTA